MPVPAIPRPQVVVSVVLQLLVVVIVWISTAAAIIFPIVQSVSLPVSNQLRMIETTSGTTTTTSTTSMTPLLDMEEYTFEQFLSDFGRSYYDPMEYQQRQRIFYDNVRTIVQHNQHQQQLSSRGTSSNGNYWMGINEFADRRANELHRGYDPYQSTIVRTTSSSSSSSRIMVESQRKLTLATSRDDHPYLHTRGVGATGRDDDDVAHRLNIILQDVTTLPDAVDWRNHGVTTPVKSQGQCGSCWAFASTAVLESHLALQTGYLYDLSPQELVSCATNPYHCGGTGGCTGATAEIAFDLVQQHGIVSEWQFGYQDGSGQTINCSLTTSNGKDSKHATNPKNSAYFRGAVASIRDYMVLPSNNYTVLMNVVAQYGPVAVSVACMPWHLYQSGIFYAPMNSSITSTTDLDHLVVLEGYGTDQETGEDYWLVRNSWGPRWGEHGYIRLKRHSQNHEEEKECGYDTTPADGTACTIDPATSDEIVPLPQKICGNSGILFDSAVPIGGYLL